jgi:hypothetical protein
MVRINPLSGSMRQKKSEIDGSHQPLFDSTRQTLAQWHSWHSSPEIWHQCQRPAPELGQAGIPSLALGIAEFAVGLPSRQCLDSELLDKARHRPQKRIYLPRAQPEVVTCTLHLHMHTVRKQRRICSNRVLAMKLSGGPLPLGLIYDTIHPA